MAKIEVVTQADKIRQRGCVGCAIIMLGIPIAILLLLIVIGARVTSEDKAESHPPSEESGQVEAGQP